MTYSQAERVSTDTVISLHFLDDDEVFRASILDTTYLFNDVLDTKKLHDSLWRLLERGNWRKLGGRLRMNTFGKLEYHIPISFDENRPPFAYTHKHFATKVEEHPVGSKFPTPTLSPSIAGDPIDLRSLSRAPDTPTSIEHFLYSDRPLLAVRIITFENATAITITWPHTLMDGVGSRTLFSNWIAVLEDRVHDVQPFYGYDFDPLASLGTKAKEESVLKKWLISPQDMLELGKQVALRSQLSPIQDEARVVCLPSQHVQHMKQRALRELALLDTENSGKLFLSDGDIISAWWAQVVINALRPASHQLVAIRNSFSMRGVLAKSLLPAGSAYMANAIMGSYTFLPAGEILKKPLSFIASNVRMGIAQQTNREQVEAFAAMARECRERTGRRPSFGDPNTIQIMFTNLDKAKFFDIDFSGAVIKEGTPVRGRPNGLGKPFYQHYEGHFQPFNNCYIFPILGKDPAGNYWLTGRLPQGVWDVIMQSLLAGTKAHL